MKKIFALGFFDGVHLGHQELLTRCCQMAQEVGAQPCAITFQQHPQALFTDNLPKLINTTEDRLLLLRRYGVAQIHIYPVIKEVMSIPWETFLEQLCNHGAVGFVCGTDFRFGNRGEGTAQKLKAYCGEKNLICSIVEDQLLDGVRISSTHIRSLLEAGRMEDAVRFLGHPHVLTGTVVAGQRIGRTIGVPTANLQMPASRVCPKYGVYVCRVSFDGETYPAVVNVGCRPTVGGDGVTVEPWILDYTGDLYGKTLTLEFYAFLREEKKFADLEQLRQEIEKNAQQTLEFFEKQ